LASFNWDWQVRADTVRLWDPATGQLLRSLKHPDDSVFLTAFSPDGKTLASATRENTLVLWDVATGQRLRQWRSPPEQCTVPCRCAGRQDAGGRLPGRGPPVGRPDGDRGPPVRDPTGRGDRRRPVPGRQNAGHRGPRGGPAGLGPGHGEGAAPAARPRGRLG